MTFCAVPSPLRCSQEALEAAMKTGLWGHALFLASKMDNRSYTTVLSRFEQPYIACGALIPISVNKKKVYLMGPPFLI